MADLIQRLPKAEMHLHIEGTLEPELMFELGARNGVELPFASVDEVRAAYEFTDLQSFLDIYYQGAGVLITAQDFDDLMWAYLERAAADGVRHAEMFFDPQTHTERGIGFECVHGRVRCGTGARRSGKLGISTMLIMCFLRHLPESAAIETLEAARPFFDRITAVGLDSSEVGHPPEDFARVVRHGSRGRACGSLLMPARRARLPTSGERSTRSKVERVDHGVASEQDEAAGRATRSMSASR